jgi:hypothetical protein
MFFSGGEMSAGEVCEIVDALNRAPKPTSQMWEFTPPRQCALMFLIPTDPLQGWLNLDSGVLITNKSIDWKDRAGHDWIQTNGVDLAAATTFSGSSSFDGTNGGAPPIMFGLFGRKVVFSGFDMVVEAAPTNSWDTLTVADVVLNWRLLNGVPEQRRNFSASSDKSDTFFFQTRKGGKGILQILGNTADNRAARIRYKLVQAAGTNAAPKMQIDRMER